MSSSFFTCSVFLSALALSNAITCYQCTGAENMPSAMSSLLSGVVSTSTNSTTCTSSTVCTPGTFCLKSANIYSATIAGKTFKYTTYTKGCSALTTYTPYMGNSTTIVSGTCYTSGASSSTSSLTGTMVNCFCNNTDKCNGVNARSAGAISIVLSVIALLAFH